MLLSQQAVLARLDQQRAVVQVAGNWMAMVQGRLPLLEKAVQTALGSPRQVVLESTPGGSAPPNPAPAPPAPAPPPPAAPVPAPAPAAVVPSAIPTPASTARPIAPAAAPAMAEAVAEPLPEEPAKPALTLAAQPDLIDDKARRLADFFNGEVVQLDGPIPVGESGETAA
jgi:DNA polymerase-3 subunit gamma/tau